MDESDSSKREAGSRKPLEDGGLREIVERAKHANIAEETPEPRPKRRRPPSRVLRTLIGLALYIGALTGFSIALVHMMHIGSCGSGSSTFSNGPECPSGTGWYVGLMIVSVFAALIGSAIAGLGIGIPMGLGFTVIGAAALYGGLTAPDSADTTATGYAMGSTFIVMGLVCLGFTIWFRRSLAGTESEAEPTLSPVGLAQLIGATAPKPLPGNELSKEEEQPGKGG